MSFPVPPEVFIVVLKYLTYKDIVNFTEVNQYTFNSILRSLPKKNVQYLVKLIDMKKYQCQHVPISPRYWKHELDCPSWARSVKFTLPKIYHCSEMSYNPTGCSFLWNYVAEHSHINESLNGNPINKILVERFLKWFHFPKKESYACFVAMSYIHLDQEFRKV